MKAHRPICNGSRCPDRETLAACRVSLRRAKDRFSRHLRETGPVVYRLAGPSRARQDRLGDREPLTDASHQR
jgi:hypothetical protein